MKIPDSIRDTLASKVAALERAILREIQYLWRKRAGSQTLAEFAAQMMRELRLPPLAMENLNREVLKAEREMASTWNDYFQGVLDEPLKPGDIERMAATYSVDFPKIQSDVRSVVSEETRRAARAEFGFNTLRRRLITRGVGASSAGALANTSVAQFSNAYMFEAARQGGIDTFLYDGPLNENTRAFCRKHLGHEYTLDEIRAMDNGQGLPVLTSCGGYNCRHYWTPVAPKRKASAEDKAEARRIEGTIFPEKGGER